MTNNINEIGRYETAKLLASYFFSLSLFALAGSLTYFAIEISSVNENIPDILTSINNTSEKIGPVIDDVGEIIVLVPPILKEIEETRKLIPPILKETEAMRKELPALLASADKASAAVVVISKEIEASRPLITEVLKEVETTRESIPPMMDKADKLINDARIAGKEVSEGAVTGAITGIIKAPFRLVGSAGKAIVGVDKEEREEGFNDDDYEMFEETALNLLNNGSVGDSQKWENPDSGNHGTIVLTKSYIDEGDSSNTECRELNGKLFTGDKEISDRNKKFCRDDDKWKFIK